MIGAPLGCHGKPVVVDGPSLRTASTIRRYLPGHNGAMSRAVVSVSSTPISQRFGLLGPFVDGILNRADRRTMQGVGARG